MTAVANTVEEIIKNNKVAMFSKRNCSECAGAKRLLKTLDADAYVIELDVEKNGAAIQQYLQQKTGQSTLPSVFINERYFGGCNDLADAQASGYLQVLLNE